MDDDLKEGLENAFFSMGFIAGTLGRTDAMEAAKLAVQIDPKTRSYVIYLRDKLNALLPPTDSPAA